jgi:23S rRNA (adenine2503-C2)-methyltransferase
MTGESPPPTPGPAPVRENLRALSLNNLEALFSELGWPRYTAGQVFTWLWQKGVSDLDSMTNLSRDRRACLAERYHCRLPELLRATDDSDGTAKFTFTLDDRNVIESVFIPDADRRTVCISTQVGCGLGCAFCYTGTLGLKRNLTWWEIAAQVLAVRSSVTRPSDLAITNAVFMGMGEPFLNRDATIEAAMVINDEKGPGIGARHITVSTAGIPEGILAFARLDRQFRLALSLNASDDETRSRLMPVNRRHPLKEVMAATREYVAARGKRVTFEYVLIDRVNNRDQDVRQLARLLKGIPCKLNLIPLNPFPGCELEAPSEKSVDAFARKLWPHVPAVTVRRSKGARILAGCGQLAGLPVT